MPVKCNPPGAGTVANASAGKCWGAFEQAEFFIDAVSGYGSDFALFPELFVAPLMADFNHLSEADAIREMPAMLNPYVSVFRKWLFRITLTSLPAVCLGRKR
jgi:hypothetical protein